MKQKCFRHCMESCKNFLCQKSCLLASNRFEISHKSQLYHWCALYLITKLWNNWKEYYRQTRQLIMAEWHIYMLANQAIVGSENGFSNIRHQAIFKTTLIARFMGPTWDRTQMGPMLAPWTLLFGQYWATLWTNFSEISTKEEHFYPKNWI